MRIKRWFVSEKDKELDGMMEWALGERPPIPEEHKEVEPTVAELLDEILSRLEVIERKIEASLKESD